MAVLYLRLARIDAILSSVTSTSPEDIENLRKYYVLCYALSLSVALYPEFPVWPSGGVNDTPMGLSWNAFLPIESQCPLSGDRTHQ